MLESEFQAAVSYLPNKADWFEGRWSGLGKPDEPVLGRRNIATAIDDDLLKAVGEVLTTVPEGLTIHKTLGRILDAKRAMFETGEGFDWATAEALAFGSLIAQDHDVRLSGQDSGRGTFSQRHAMWVDQTNGERYIPLTTIDSAAASKCATARFPNSACLASNMAIRFPIRATLVLWEAQFGDFANGAQVIIDQFIAVGRSQVAARQRARDAAAARLRRAGAGA